MDPITLFALANGAVSAVKAGCKLYKDIKGAAGDVKDVLKDLDDQFKKLHPPEKPPTVEQKKQFVEERSRIVELNKRGGETTNIYQEIGNHLGTYYDNYYKCQAIFEEEEKRAHTEIYTGDDSLGKRALQRVLMKKQLEQMAVELRELMVYQSPPELGALYSEVEAMMRVMGEEQKVLIARQMKADAKRAKDRAKLLNKYFLEGIGVMGLIFVIACITALMSVVVQDRIEKYPQYGTGWIPQTEEQRISNAKPKIYVGR
jgi:hypothetical protein